MRILRGVSSHLLPCGCLAGVYETYDGAIVTIIDAPAASCGESAHAEGNVVPSDSRHEAGGHPRASFPGRRDRG